MCYLPILGAKKMSYIQLVCMSPTIPRTKILSILIIFNGPSFGSARYKSTEEGF